MSAVESETARQAITLTLGDYEWRPLDPKNPTGPQMAVLWGDPTSGPHGALLRVPAGFESPMHRHSYDERMVMIQGVSLHWIEGCSYETATPLAAGDFFMMPAGVNHVSAAAEGEDSIELITQDGPFDFTLTE